MKTLPAAAALVLAASTMATACSRHDDAANQAAGNDALVTELPDNAGTLDGNLAAPDAPLNGSDAGANAAAPAGGNAL